MFALLVLLLLLLARPHHTDTETELMDLTKQRTVSVISKRVMAAAIRAIESIPYLTTPGVVARNECDTHADTCCAGSNWKLMELTNEVCEVSPFLDTYESVKEVPVARCCTVWTSPDTGQEYLLVGDQMLWFGTQLENSLINPNQIREYGLRVYDNPFELNRFGIDCQETFVPFQTTGTIVHFESRVPTEWEEKHLPVLLLTSEYWDPTGKHLGVRTREQNEMRTIRNLTSGMRKTQVSSVRKQQEDSRAVTWGQVEQELDKVTPVSNLSTLCHRLIGAVNIATSFREDIDALEDKRKVADVITKDRHSRVGPEELARKWNVGLETAKNTLETTTQYGIRTAVHPMTT